MATLPTSAAVAAQPSGLVMPAGTGNVGSNGTDSSITSSVGIHVSSRSSLAMVAADSADRLISARLGRCRQWLHPRRSIRGGPMAGCPDIYDTSIGLSSPTSMSDCLSAADGNSATPSQQQPSQTAPLSAGIQRPPLDEQGTQILHAMHGRWVGLLAQPLASSRSFASRRAHQARALNSRASALCSPSTPSPSPSPSRSTSSLAPSAQAIQGISHVSPNVSGTAATNDDQLDDDGSFVGNQLPRPRVSIDDSNGHGRGHGQTLPHVAMRLHPDDGMPPGRWACTCGNCSEAREMLQMQLHMPPQMPLSPPPPLQLLPSSLPPRASSMAFADTDYTANGSDIVAYTESSAARAGEVPSESGSVYIHEDQAVSSVAANAAAMASSAASALQQQAGMPTASAIAAIFSIGQPAQHVRAKGVSRAKRLSRRMTGLAARVLHPIKTRSRRSAAEIAAGSECSSALIDALKTETALATAIHTLSKTRSSGRSLPFRMRADRVHMAQGQLLHCIHTLFVHMVPADARRSRHYRFYLPEDDQIELDRGFSESVLFAAQALARGYQIRGTEMHTQALREPAWMLCSVWAAVRHVLHVRGSALWDNWVCISEAPEALDALRSVLHDFDDAWVRFERDLCFAYFGLGNAQVAGMMDPNEGEGDVAQEEEFSLLVVLLSETLQRCLEAGLVTAEQMETMDPLLILALPRLAILNAIACKGIEGLCFSEPEVTDTDANPDQQQQQQQQPVFWWFREYTAQCQRICSALSQWPAALVGILQTVFVAEEADVALENAEPALEKMLRAAEPETVPELGFVLPRKTIDLESIIDSPRSVRSMSFDCISSVCTPSSEYMDSIYKDHVGSARPHAKSVGEAPDFDECLAARIYAACSDINAPPLPKSPIMSVVPQKQQQQCLNPQSTSEVAFTSGELAGSLATTAVSSHLSWPIPLSPIAATISSPRVVSGIRSDALVSKDKTSIRDRDLERRAKLDACRAAAKQIYVDVCTVSDSLHSGPFARPFRVALEIVFRMNAEQEEPLETST
ncbi:hypothetical protein FB639_002102 [Coemansia asiatica]|nr:hypothetical protein FB639_002102 [Coemansia asiatica]